MNGTVKIILVGIFAVVLFVIAVGLFFTRKPTSTNISETTTNQEKKEPVASNSGQPMQIDTTKQYTAVLKTDQGSIVISLQADKTPITVNNFVALSKKGFYNNTIFHRVIDGFMIQAGDPKGDGSGGPGYSFNDEPFDGEYTRGTVAMANAGPNTNGSQFFIMHKDNQTLPKNYVIFGLVTKGMDVVDKIASAKVEANTFGESSKPVVPVKITSVDIREE